MQWFNTKQDYGWINISLHWLLIPVILGLYAVGLWMADLDYYSPWYRIVPHWHKSVGVLMFVLMMARLIIKFSSTGVESLAGHKPWEKQLAKTIHWLFYLAVIVMFVSGYFITTAKGDALEVFNWFSLPALVNVDFNLEDIAGEIHEICAHVIIIMVILHAVGALKHHFVDRDSTLKRMLGQIDESSDG